MIAIWQSEFAFEKEILRKLLEMMNNLCCLFNLSKTIGLAQPTVK